jgi:Adenylosuccinate synthetase
METETVEKQGAFLSSLKRNNKQIRDDRAIAIGESAQLIYKRAVEDLEVGIKQMKRDQENMLDKNIGFFPNVTRSNVGTKNILSFNNNFRTYLVTRAYQTRHGNGDMTNENIPHNILSNPNETNITNKYQGKFRRTLLDVDLLQYAISRDKYIRDDKNKTLCITCLDHIKNEYRFTHKGNLVYCNDENDFIKRISTILDIKNLLLSHSPDSSLIQKI